MNSQEKIFKKFIKIAKQFWLKHETKFVLIIGFILVAVISFEAGILKGQNWQSAPLVIEKPAGGQESCQADQNTPSQTQNSALEGQKQAQTAKTITAQNSSAAVGVNCAFVGSKNSDKYHLPNCQWAKRIKPENIVCFQNEEEARSKGYSPCSSCVK